jgi:molybdate transport system substrate-binding protein
MVISSQYKKGSIMQSITTNHKSVLPTLKRIFRIKYLGILLLLSFCNIAYSQITVACAANMQYAMEQIKTSCAKTGMKIKVIYGASGKFVTQIKNGAPFDVFVSADMAYPESLYVWKYAATKPQIYAYGKLVIWTIKKIDITKRIACLQDPLVKTIAIPDPKGAPYGREAIRALKNAGIYDAVLPHLVYGESISQTAQYIVIGSADIGFNAKAIVLSDQMKGKGSWVEVDSSLYTPIAQGAVICKYGEDNNPKLSQQFVKYLLGKESRNILELYGYILP